MIAVGIDPGLAHCGFAAMTGERVLYRCTAIVTKRDKDRMGDTQARLAEVLDAVEGQINTLADVAVIVIEWPMVGGRNDRGHGTAKSAAQTFAAAGALVGMLRDRAPVVLSPVPPTWRAQVGNVDGARLSTEDLHAHLDTIHGVTALVGKTNAPHALDAVGLATYGLNHLATQRREAA